MHIECLKIEYIEPDTAIVELTEVNKDCRNVPNDNTIWNGTASWRIKRRIQISQNYHYPAKSEFLVDGTATKVFGGVVFRISDQCADERKLGG